MMFAVEEPKIAIVAPRNGAGDESKTLERQLRNVAHHLQSSSVVRYVMLSAERPCQELFEELAVTSPWRLSTYLRDETLTAGLRARAAEAVGRVHDAHTAMAILLPLLNTAPPIVQEGAVYALERHLTPEVRVRLQQLAEAPATSPGVREAAEDALLVE